jgi:hypothetical protein
LNRYRACAKAGTIDSGFEPDQFMALDHPDLRGSQIKTIKKDGGVVA